MRLGIIRFFSCAFLIVVIIIIIFSNINKPVEIHLSETIEEVQGMDEGGNSHMIPDLSKDWEEIMIQAVVEGDSIAGMNAENQFYWMNKLGYKDYTLMYDEVLNLAKIMQEEDGIDWPDWAIMAIGEVILNRVQSDEWPNSIVDVLTQRNPIQYAPVYNDGWNEFYPEEKYVQLAVRLLKGERVINNQEVVWQALFEQGECCVITYYDVHLCTTTYFCK